jgi:hypothetical protein
LHILLLLIFEIGNVADSLFRRKVFADITCQNDRGIFRLQHRHEFSAVMVRVDAILSMKSTDPLIRRSAARMAF